MSRNNGVLSSSSKRQEIASNKTLCIPMYTLRVMTALLVCRICLRNRSVIQTKVSTIGAYIDSMKRSPLPIGV